jgi:N-acetylmuramoyl-L-alanine amidase CwlA
MGYTLKKLHTKVNFNTGNSGRKYIVIHYTGNNTDTASANANYFYNVNRDASAHYFVDDSNVYEVVAPDNTAWSVGVNYGSNNLFGKCTNSNSLNIEMCSTNGKITQATFDNTVALTKSLMTKYNIPVSNVVRHYDVCSKSCPGWSGWIGKDTSIWDNFKKSLTAVKLTAKSNFAVYNKQFKDSVGGASKVVITGTKGNTVTLVKDCGNGMSKVKYGNTTGYVFNSNFKPKQSTYKTVTLPKGTKLKRVNAKDTTKFEATVTLKVPRKFYITSIITSGTYKGYKVLKRNGKVYYYL